MLDDGLVSRLKKSLEEKQNNVAIQWMTVIIMPLCLSAGIYFAHRYLDEFDSMHDSLIHMQDDIASIRNEVEHHSKQLDTIWTLVNQQLKQHASAEP